MIDLIGVKTNSETLLQMGIIEFILDFCIFSKKLMTVVGGFDQFPNALIPLVGESNIRYNTKVSKIETLKSDHGKSNRKLKFSKHYLLITLISNIISDAGYT